MGAGSPARNPTTSPIILRHRCHRRPKTLRMLLGRPSSNRPCRSLELPLSLPTNNGAGDNTDDFTSRGGHDKGGVRVRHKLKDLLVSTSLEREEEEAGDEDRNEGRRAKMQATLLGKSGIEGGVADGMRRLRCRLIRSSWRPSMGLGLGNDLKSRKLRRRRLMVSPERRETSVRRERWEKASRVRAEESNRESRSDKVSLPQSTTPFFPSEDWTGWLDWPAKLARGERGVRGGREGRKRGR